jgi:hypothetical protein
MRVRRRELHTEPAQCCDDSRKHERPKGDLNRALEPVLRLQPTQTPIQYAGKDAIEKQLRNENRHGHHRP